MPIMKTTLGLKLRGFGFAGAWLLAAAVVFVAAGSCYNPSIVNGGLRCADGGQCPEGFLCHPTGRCYKPDTGPVDCGSTQLCADQPLMNEECNLACQTGCGCGQRCNVTKNGPRCVATVTPAKMLGQVCMLTNGGEAGSDDCGPGLVCLREQCGGVNRCYRLCSTDDQCGKPADDLHCRIPVVTANAAVSFLACDVPHTDCDPIAKTGCPTGLTCFVLNTGATLCDCPTNTTMQPDAKAGLEGSPCSAYSDCKGGLICVAIAGDSAPTCRPLCTPGKVTCATGMSCKPVGAKFGYCAP